MASVVRSEISWQRPSLTQALLNMQCSVRSTGSRKLISEATSRNRGQSALSASCEGAKIKCFRRDSGSLLFRQRQPRPHAPDTRRPDEAGPVPCAPRREGDGAQTRSTSLRSTWAPLRPFPPAVLGELYGAGRARCTINGNGNGNASRAVAWVVASLSRAPPLQPSPVNGGGSRRDAARTTAWTVQPRGQVHFPVARSKAPPRGAPP